MAPIDMNLLVNRDTANQILVQMAIVLCQQRHVIQVLEINHQSSCDLSRFTHGYCGSKSRDTIRSTRSMEHGHMDERQCSSTYLQRFRYTLEATGMHAVTVIKYRAYVACVARLLHNPSECKNGCNCQIWTCK
eukprot:956973_1